MDRPDYLSVAQDLYAERFSDAGCGFIAGSIVTGHGTPSSDIDLIILYDNDTAETYRESVMRDGWPVEIFVHNLKSQDYFFNEDIQSGGCSTMTMVATGHVIGANTALGEHRKTIAEKLMAAGPEPLSADKINWMRYAITDLFDDLRHPKDADYVPAILGELFNRVGNFHLRAQNKWSGTGKQLVKALKKDDPSYAADFIAAFQHAHQHDIEPLRTIIATTLQPYGGWLFEGYKSVSSSWTTAE